MRAGTRPATISSPHLNAGIRSQVKLVARLDIECRVPRVDVADRVGAVFVGRVAVGHDDDCAAPRARIFLRQLWRECKEEPLVAGQAVAPSAPLCRRMRAR